MKHYGFLHSEFRNSSAQSARYHIIPVPFEATVSYMGGTAKGPGAILEASLQLEQIVEGMGEPGMYGIHTTAPVDSTYTESPQEVYHRISKLMNRSLDLEAVPILLGGEHSITNGAINMISRRFDPGTVGILQFDAHMDLRDQYEKTPWSHASVMRRAVEADIPVYQVGIRNYCIEELEIRSQYSVGYTDASQLYQLSRSSEGYTSLRLPEEFPQNLYITFDVDCLDASLMPATGTPEPGGLFWWDAAELLSRFTRGRRIIGADVVELAPAEALHHCSYTAAKLTYYLMGLASPGLSRPPLL